MDMCRDMMMGVATVSQGEPYEATWQCQVAFLLGGECDQAT